MRLFWIVQVGAIKITRVQISGRGKQKSQSQSKYDDRSRGQRDRDWKII